MEPKPKRKRKKKGEFWEFDEESDHPLHEQYVKQEHQKQA